MGGRRTLDRLLTLEEIGVPLSRNRAFEVFSDPRYRPILHYANHLRAIGRLLRRSGDRLIIRQDPMGDTTIVVSDRRARYRHSVFLDRAEVAWLVHHDRTLERWLGNPLA